MRSRRCNFAMQLSALAVCSAASTVAVGAAAILIYFFVVAVLPTPLLCLIAVDPLLVLVWAGVTVALALISIPATIPSSRSNTRSTSFFS